MSAEPLGRAGLVPWLRLQAQPDVRTLSGSHLQGYGGVPVGQMVQEPLNEALQASCCVDFSALQLRKNPSVPYQVLL